MRQAEVGIEGGGYVDVVEGSTICEEWVGGLGVCFEGVDGRRCECWLRHCAVGGGVGNVVVRGSRSSRHLLAYQSDNRATSGAEIMVEGGCAPGVLADLGVAISALAE